MPKLSYKITEFHGGTNSNADPRDLADNEQPYTRDVDVSKYGLIKIIPEAYAGAAKERESTNEWSSGVGNYGLHFFGADNKPTDNADGNFTLTALYDGRHVDIYGAGTFAGWSTASNWAANEIDFTGGSGSSQPLFYNADGVLRVYDRALANVPKWYGHIEAERFPGVTQIRSSSGSALNDWVSSDASIAAPTTGKVLFSTPQVGTDVSGSNPDYDTSNGGVNSANEEYIGAASVKFLADNSLNLRVGVNMNNVVQQRATNVNVDGTEADSHELISFIDAVQDEDGTTRTPGTTLKVGFDRSDSQTGQIETDFEELDANIKIDESRSILFPVYTVSYVASSYNIKVGSDTSNYYRWNYSGSDLLNGSWNLFVLSKDKNTSVTGSPPDWGEQFEYFSFSGHVNNTSSGS